MTAVPRGHYGSSMSMGAARVERRKLSERYRVVDADGHVLEPPTGLWERAPAEFKDRMWRVVRDAVRCHFNEGQAPKVIRARGARLAVRALLIGSTPSASRD